MCTLIVYTRDSSLYVRANSCVNKLKAEGVGDSASWMLSCDFHLLLLGLCITSQAVFRLSLHLVRVAAEV